MGENGKESNLSDNRKPTNVNKTRKSRLVKDGAVVEPENGETVGSGTSKTVRSSTSGQKATATGKTLAGSKPVPAAKKSKLVQTSGAASTSSSSSTSTSSSRSVSSSSSTTTTELSYAAYNGDAGVARFIWWALASLALLIALGLVATQCFGSSESDSSASQVASSSGNDVESNTQDPVDATESDVSANNAAPAGPVSELEANSLAALAAAELANVDVSIDDGAATLIGAVATEADRAKAEETVAEIDGVDSVINNLEIDETLEPTSAATGDESGTNAEEPSTSTTVPEPSETPAAEPEPAEPAYNG